MSASDKKVSETATSVNKTADEQLSEDCTPTATAALIRESADLRISNKDLKRKNMKVWGVVLIQSIILLVMVTGFMYAFPKYRYIPTTDNRAICQVNTEAAARLEPSDLTEFAKDAAIESYTYDYVNYREKINSTGNKFYTKNGRKAFMSSLDTSGNLERVLVGKLILRAQTIQVPQIEEVGFEGVNQYWILHVPLAIEFYVGGESAPKSRQQFLAVVKVLQQTANAANPKGIGVDSITLAPFTASK